MEMHSPWIRGACNELLSYRRTTSIEIEAPYTGAYPYNDLNLLYCHIMHISSIPREEKLYGDDIIDATSSFSYSITSDAPPVKSNNVSFMKPEQLPLDCRSILAVGKSHICYSVTQKKNLLRLIDTSTGEKVILRGHESAVLDLRFSPADSSRYMRFYHILSA